MPNESEKGRTIYSWAPVQHTHRHKCKPRYRANMMKWLHSLRKKTIRCAILGLEMSMNVNLPSKRKLVKHVYKYLLINRNKTNTFVVAAAAAFVASADDADIVYQMRV